MRLRSSFPQYSERWPQFASRDSRTSRQPLELLKWRTHFEGMAKITYDDPDGVETVEVDAGKISDSGKVHGVRVQLDDGGYLHLPYSRLYAVEESEEEGKVDYSGA